MIMMEAKEEVSQRSIKSNKVCIEVELEGWVNHNTFAQGIAVQHITYLS